MLLRSTFQFRPSKHHPCSQPECKVGRAQSLPRPLPPRGVSRGRRGRPRCGTGKEHEAMSSGTAPTEPAGRVHGASAASVWNWRRISCRPTFGNRCPISLTSHALTWCSPLTPQLTLLATPDPLPCANSRSGSSAWPNDRGPGCVSRAGRLQVAGGLGSRRRWGSPSSPIRRGCRLRRHGRLGTGLRRSCR